MVLVAGCFEREAGVGRARVTATADTQLVSLGGSATREKEGGDVCAGFCSLLEFWGEAQHRVKQRVECDVQASGK